MLDLNSALRRTIISAVKKVFSSCYIAKEVRQEACDKDVKGPRGGKRYICAECGGSFAAQDTQVDHISPVIPVDRKAKNMSWDEIITRLFCSKDNLQLLCKECHSNKSKEENSGRDRKRKNVSM